jgi:hypothetical protein
MLIAFILQQMVTRTPLSVNVCTFIACLFQLDTSWSCFNYQLNAQFLYYILIYIYYIIVLDMFRVILCSSSGGQIVLLTASGIVTLCKQPYSVPVESRL